MEDWRLRPSLPATLGLRTFDDQLTGSTGVDARPPFELLRTYRYAVCKPLNTNPFQRGTYSCRAGSICIAGTDSNAMVGYFQGSR